MNYAPIVWNTLMVAIDNPYGVAGLVGNLYAESGLHPCNLQSSFEKKLNCTDGTYTKAVDEGIYNKFITDGAGYGLAQWTYSTRKANLLEFAKEQEKSIGDINMQLAFLIKEMQETYPKVWDTLINATSVREASNYVLFHYEQPRDQSQSMQDKRTEYGLWYYDNYAQKEEKQVSIDYDKYINSKDIHYLSNSGGDENGNIYNGKAGDQTGKEWTLRAWYKRPWTHMFRYEKNENVGLELAKLGIKAALNDKIGYDQYQRTTYWQQLQKVNYDPAAITEPCEADCSAGVAANVKACGYLLNIDGLKNVSNSMSSRNTISQLKNAGFTMYTDKKYLNNYDYLKPGDILLYENHHVSMNITYGNKVEQNKKVEETQTVQQQDDFIGKATALLNMNFRKEPSLSGEYITLLYSGTIVDVIDILPTNWFKIKYKDTIGYVSNTSDRYWRYEPHFSDFNLQFNFDRELVGEYKITADTAANLREGPGKEYKIIKTLTPKHSLICKGFYLQDADNTKWYYVISDNNIKGLISSRMAAKI